MVAGPNELHTRDHALPETSGLLADSGDASTEPQDEDPEELNWGEKYREATLEDLIRVQALFTETIDAEAQPEFRRQFDSGLAEHLGEGNTLKIKGSDHDPLEISAYLFEPKNQGGGIYKAVLPREQFAELYELKAELVWVEAAIDERYQSAASTPRGGSRRDR